MTNYENGSRSHDRDSPPELLVCSTTDIEDAAHRLAMGIDRDAPDWYNDGYIDGLYDLSQLVTEGEHPDA